MPYDESLFASAADYYANYRVPYPQALIYDVVSHFRLDGTGRLLDLGCGPGTFTIPLAPHFAGAVAVDPELGMIAALSSAAPQIETHVMRAEELPASLGRFRVVTCGSSFHWMDRDLVLRRARDEWLEEGGGVAMAGGSDAWFDGDLDWHQVITRVIKKYLGEKRRAGSQIARHMTQERFEEALPRNGWRVELHRGYEVELEWTPDTIVGHLWSTSYAGRARFGEQVDEFERELRAELMSLPADGIFRETGIFGLVCGRP